MLKNAIKLCPLYMAWPLYSWTHNRCGYWHKIWKRWDPSTSVMEGRVAPEVLVFPDTEELFVDYGSGRRRVAYVLLSCLCSSEWLLTQAPERNTNLTTIKTKQKHTKIEEELVGKKIGFNRSGRGMREGNREHMTKIYYIHAWNCQKTIHFKTVFTWCVRLSVEGAIGCQVNRKNEQLQLPETQNYLGQTPIKEMKERQ